MPVSSKVSSVTRASHGANESKNPRGNLTCALELTGKLASSSSDHMNQMGHESHENGRPPVSKLSINIS